MSAEEKRVKRITWAESQGRACRTREEVAQQAIDRAIATLGQHSSYRAGMKCWEDWYAQSHTVERWGIECQFFGKKPWQLPLLTDQQSYALQYQTDESFMIKERIRRQIRKKAKEAYGTGYIASILKSNKSVSSLVEQLTGCTVDELRESLQDSLIGSGYTWDDFLKNKLHIDHVIPKALFDIHDHGQARLCWHKDNLRLIDKGRNLQKACKVVASLIDTRQEVYVS